MAKKKKSISKYNVNDVLLHKRENKFFICVEKGEMPDKGWLYTLKLVGAGVTSYKRCYESDLTDKYDEVKNPESIKLLYGKV